MQEKFSGSVTLGYASLFLLLWLSHIPYVNWYPNETFTAAVPLWMIVSVTLAIAGIFCFFYDAKIDGVLFLFLGTTGFAGALRFVIYPNLEANTAPSQVDGWSAFITGVVILYLWLVSMKSNPFKQFFLLALWLALFGSALLNWFGLLFFAYIAGYLGLIAAVLAGLYSASTLLPPKKAAP